MLFRFLLLSDEVDDFKREIKIDAEATFLDLHHAILKSVNFDKSQMTSFFICEDDWSKKMEVTLIEMDTSSEVDNYLMEDTKLEELLEDEHQKLIYVFDYMTERGFFMELREIIPGQNLAEPVCSLSVGLPPSQSVDFEDTEVKSINPELGENFYGDSDYNIDELDKEGFEGFGDEAADSSFEDERY